MVKILNLEISISSETAGVPLGVKVVMQRLEQWLEQMKTLTEEFAASICIQGTQPSLY